MITAHVVARRRLTPRVDEFTLSAIDNSPLPEWAPGSHIDVRIPASSIGSAENTLTRQYSLCSAPLDLSRYRIAVNRAEVHDGGRGGSAGLHDHATVGAVVEIGEPRNHFPLTRALNYVFIAAGIGVTPMIPLAAQAEWAGRPWRMQCLTRNEADMPYLDELRGTYGDKISVHTSGSADTDGAAQGRIDLGRALADLPRGTAVYVCGPGTLAEDVAAAVGPQPAVDVFVEQFTAPDLDGEAGAPLPFDVTLATSGETFTVPADASLLDTLERRGTVMASSCREGVCGTCEVAVVSGEVDHRDNVLTPEEASENESMMPCVSRCRSGRLVLDL